MIVYMSHIPKTDYLDYLQKKESGIVFSLKERVFSHGELSSYIKVFKGLILGFGLGNLLIRVRSSSLFYSLFIFLLSFCLSVLLINYERRVYKRKSFKHALKKTLLIFLVCLFFSLFVFFYSDYKGLIIVLASTLFFASLTYSME